MHALPIIDYPILNVDSNMEAIELASYVYYKGIIYIS